MKDKFWNFLENTVGNAIELRIEGDIVASDDKDMYDYFGMTATDPNSFKEELKKYDGKDLTVWINSNGGSTVAASCIYTLLKNRKGETTIKIDGVALSAASVIAMAGTKTLMSPTAIMMIHNPLTCAYGDYVEMEKTIEVLNEVKESIVNAYELKSKLSRQEISKLMDEETWMSANKAMELGFCDALLYENIDINDDISNKLISASRAVFNCRSHQSPKAVGVDNGNKARYIAAKYNYNKIKIKETQND